ncbi:hypothetical protein K2X33_11100 [bacterium]|nr:hypothetical protein [bacterium]
MDLRELAITQTTAGRHPWESARADAVEFLLRQAGVQPQTRILDFGCGDSFLVSHLGKCFGMEQVSAIDRAFTPEVKISLHKQYGAHLRLFDSLPAFEQAGGTSDLVLLLDVLEHCEKDVETLAELVRSPAVAPGAGFLITVPAFQGLFSKHDDFLGHYRRYSLEQMVEVAEASGLQVEKRSYFFSSLLAPRALQVALERMGLSKQEAKGLGGYTPRKFVDSAIRGVLLADFRVCEGLSRLGVHVPGLSCMVFARKMRSV